MLRYYNGIAGRVIDVDVNDIIEREVRRSCWREKKQRERYYMRVVPLEDGYGFDRVECDFANAAIREEQIRVLRRVLKSLNERQKKVIQCIYYEEMKLTETAKLLGVSVPYLSKYHKNLKGIIKEKFIRLYKCGRI